MQTTYLYDKTWKVLSRCIRLPRKEQKALQEGIGIFWTQIHTPVYIVEHSHFTQMDELDQYTKMAG